MCANRGIVRRVAFFGLFGNSGEAALKKHAARVADKRAQAPDRWDSIQALGAMKSEAAVRALLRRFGFYTDPSITDQDEKDEACRLIVETGEVAVAPILESMRGSGAIGWSLKLLDRLLPAERVVAEVLETLETMDTEYERDPERKIHLLQSLEDRRDERIAAMAARFLEDVNESARFHAVGAIAIQADPSEVRHALDRRLVEEDSVRIRTRILEIFEARNWNIAPERRDAIVAMLPASFTLDAQSVPRSR